MADYERIPSITFAGLEKKQSKQGNVYFKGSIPREGIERLLQQAGDLEWLTVIVKNNDPKYADKRPLVLNIDPGKTIAEANSTVGNNKFNHPSQRQDPSQFFTPEDAAKETDVPL